MKLADLLRQKRDTIVDQWFDSVARSYPADTSRYLKDQADQFQNPVGHTLRNRLPVLLAALLGDADEAGLAEAVEDIVRIRTVQSDVPSQAVSFVFLLKNVVRRELGNRLEDPTICDELREFESTVDGLALIVFDQLVVCKEKIYEIRAQEIRRRSAKLIEQVNKLYGGLDRSPINPE